MSERKKLISKLDRAFSKYIRERDNNRCVVCGKPGSDCGHYFSRVAHSTRWNPDNCACQCRSCNWNHERNPEPLRRYMIQNLGEEGLEALEKLHHSSVKYSDTMLEEMIRYYKDKTDGL